MKNRSHIKLAAAVFLLPVLLAGCGTFQLSSGAIPLSYKTQDQMQLDNLSCKDQAKLEANTAGRQAGAFALGLTIVGAPLAYELEKSKQREVYKFCMEKRGYRVLPPKDGTESSTAAKPISPPPLTPALVVTPAPALPFASKAPETNVQPVVQSAPSFIPRDETTQLQKLKELRDKGLITSEEYEKKRREIIDRM